MAVAEARAFGVYMRARIFTLVLTLETPLEVPVSKNNSKADESIPQWLTGLGSETFEQQLAFRNWMQLGGAGRGDEHLEIVKQGWLPHIRREHKAASQDV